MTPREIDMVLGVLREHGAQLGRIEKHAAETNGQVKELQLWRARMEGAKAALSWLPGLLTGIAGGVVVATVAAFLT